MAEMLVARDLVQAFSNKLFPTVTNPYKVANITLDLKNNQVMHSRLTLHGGAGSHFCIHWDNSRPFPV